MKCVCLSVFVLFCVTSHLTAQNLVVNGDFETDTFGTWPGYIAGGSNPEQITGWVGEGGNGINPVVSQENPTVTGWTRNEDSLQNIGVNPVTDGRQPFADNGDVDGGIMFMQGTSSVYQVITGLTVGETYTFGADYNARNCCGDTPTVSLELNGSAVEDFPDPFEFLDGEVFPIEVGLWWRTEFDYTATSEELRIEFFTEPTAGGDATFLLDNVTLTSGGDNLVVNGDFEQDLDKFATWPGYIGSGEVTESAPFRDNGNNESQVAFLQSTAAIQQEISDLSSGTEYTVSFDFNARACCGDFPVPSLLINDEPIDEFADEVGAVLPVEGENEWYSYQTTYIADGDSAVLRIQTMSESEGDSTFLIDNVFFGIPTACDPNSQGDLDGNGQVDFADFLLLSGNFGNAVSSHADGDIDCNGTVEFADFLVLSGNFGTEVGAASVPEPSGLLFVSVGFVSFLGIRRRRALH